MDLLTAIILGIVEGVSEFLPISSTGHMILASHLMGLEHTEFLKSFEISIQVGAILSVVALYWRLLLVNIEVIKRVIVAFIPTGILGLTPLQAYQGISLGAGRMSCCGPCCWEASFSSSSSSGTGKRKTTRERSPKSSYKTAVIIGLFQSIAMIPGVSRSASTIVGGLILGLKRKTIVEFSFLLAVPTMLAATVYDLIKTASQMSLPRSIS